MKTYLHCYPCLVRHALQAAEKARLEPDAQRQVVNAVLGLLCELTPGVTPPQVAQAAHRLLREVTGKADFYVHEKQLYNQRALELLPWLREQIKKADDPFAAAVRLAVAGNVIDFGTAAPFNLEEELRHALSRELGLSHLEDLRGQLESASSIVYLADNTGEIVFDLALIEYLLERYRARITAVVRGASIINDATLADAQMVGLTDLVPVVANGSDAPGTVLGEVSDEVRELLKKADLVISKGQGNFETLAAETDEPFFLLKAKCAVVAEHLGVRRGDYVVASAARLSQSWCRKPEA